MPAPTVVDLYASGAGAAYNGSTTSDFTLLFLPNGSVAGVFVGSAPLTPVTAPIFLLVGKRERMTNDTATYVQNNTNEPTFTNYQDLKNLWVIINPQTGLVSTEPVAVNSSCTQTLPVPLPPPARWPSKRKESEGSDMKVVSGQWSVVSEELAVRGRRSEHYPLAPLSPLPSPRSPRRGISLLEVLISVFIIAIGLLGVASLIPAGRLRIVETNKCDRTGACGRAGLHDIKIRRFCPTIWQPSYAYLVGTLVTPTSPNGHAYQMPCGRHERHHRAGLAREWQQRDGQRRNLAGHWDRIRDRPVGGLRLHPPWPGTFGPPMRINLPYTPTSRKPTAFSAGTTT